MDLLKKQAEACSSNGKKKKLRKLSCLLAKGKICAKAFLWFLVLLFVDQEMEKYVPDNPNSS